MSADIGGGRLPPFANHLDSMLVLHDPETGAILDANQAAEAAYGYSVETLRGRDVSLLSADPVEFSIENAQETIRAASNWETQRFDWKIKRANGELRWIDVSLNRIVIGEAEYVLAEVTDITEFKRQTERVELLHRILRHNLRNEMNVVKGYAEELRDDIAGEDEHDLAETISTCADELLAMGERVTDLAALAEQSLTNARSIQVTEVIEEIVTDLEASHPEAEFVVKTELPIELSSDGSLELAIEQAVENALVHHDETPRVAIRTALEDVGSRAVIQVMDDGPPIPENELVVIDPTAKRSPTKHGTGMGLFLMWWCAESLGGKLEIAPGEDRGNVVTFTLPVIADEHGTTAGETVETESESGS